MATALAASMTCSTSLCVTSLSRMATTPWELRLRTWLPAIPANTEWISQPAMSSASSTARWMDCTVDSMLTTTPFFRPREGWEPSPSTSIAPSGPTSPTRATTLEVPMSRPTMRFLSDRLSIAAAVLIRFVSGATAPADCESVGITHVYVGNVVTALSHQLQRRDHEFVETLVHLAPAEAHGHPVGQVELPGAPRIEPQRRHVQSRLGEAALLREILLRNGGFLSLRARQTGELG